MKTTADAGLYTPDEGHKTTFSFDPIGNLWHAWSSRPEHIEKLVSGQWELAEVDAEGASFTAPEHALQIGVASGKKLAGKALREREANLYRAQVNEAIALRYRRADDKEVN